MEVVSEHCSSMDSESARHNIRSVIILIIMSEDANSIHKKFQVKINFTKNFMKIIFDEKNLQEKRKKHARETFPC